MEQVSIRNPFDFNSLDQKDQVIVEYVWLGGTGHDLRSKCKTYSHEITSVDQLDEWNYDGSSTWQAPTHNSEVLIRPVCLFDDPFRGKPNKIVMCDTYHVGGKPTNTNFRYFAKTIFDKTGDHDPWFGIEQEYQIMIPTGTGQGWPIGFPMGGFPKPQGNYYCSNSTRWTHGREIADSHYKACLAAGVKIYGINAEVCPGQWEFQIGTCHGMEIGDHMWMGRFLLHRVCEMYGVYATFEPKPIKGDWNGIGCHTNFSTKGTREDNDQKCINEHMQRLSDNHLASISLYGEDNEYRLTGKYETSSMEKFSFGVANRGSSVRIPRTTAEKGNGYYEDRRPGGNIDPYAVCASIFSITCLENHGLQDMVEHFNKYKEHKKTICESFL